LTKDEAKNGISAFPSAFRVPLQQNEYNQYVVMRFRAARHFGGTSDALSWCAFPDVCTALGRPSSACGRVGQTVEGVVATMFARLVRIDYAQD
jgi:hypothetical protein